MGIITRPYSGTAVVERRDWHLQDRIEEDSRDQASQTSEFGLFCKHVRELTVVSSWQSPSFMGRSNRATVAHRVLDGRNSACVGGPFPSPFQRMEARSG